MKCDICKKQIKQDLIGTPVCKVVCLDCYKSYNIKNEKDFEKLTEKYKELEEREDRMSFAFYVALFKTLEQSGMTDNIPSAIDQLVGKDCGKYADMYNEFKHSKQENAMLKKALDLACADCERAYDLEYLKWNVKISNSEEFKKEYLRKAKESIDEDRNKI